MFSSGPSKDNSFMNGNNPYMNELKMHPKMLSLKDGKLQIEDIQGPKGEGSLGPGWRIWNKRSSHTRRWRNVQSRSFTRLIKKSSLSTRRRPPSFGRISSHSITPLRATNTTL